MAERREPALEAAGLHRLANLPECLSPVQPQRLRAGLALAVDEVARGDLVLHECAPRHFRHADGAWTFQCQVTVGGPDGERREVWLEGTFRPAGTPQVAPADREVAFGSPAWCCVLPELGVALRTAPPDTSLPMLPHLIDPERARVLLEDAIRAGDPGHAGLRIAACRPRVMRYARGSRCTIRYELEHARGAAGGDRRDVVVAKTYRGDKGAKTFQGMRALWNSELSRSPAVAIAEPLAYLPERRVLVQGPVAEDQTLKELICSSLRQGTPAAMSAVNQYVARAAEGLAALHGCGVTHGGTVTLEAEIAEVRTVIDRLARLVPDVPGVAAPLLARVVRLAAEHPADAVRPSHGTFRPAQVLLHQGRVGFIDFDDFGQAEPALDVARFRAGIRDCWVRTLVAEDGTTPSPEATAATMTALESVCEWFLRHYEAVAPVSRERVVLWETLDLLTDVLHAWTRMSPGRLLAGMLTLEDHLRRTGLMAGLGTRAGSGGPVTGTPARRSTDLATRRRGARRQRTSTPVAGAGHTPETSDLTGLHGLATLPGWLLEVARPDRLRTGLSRWVEEFARGDLVLQECRPKHFRLQGAAWTFLCRVTTGSADGGHREVLLEGTVHPPGTPQPAQDARVAAFGSEVWSCRLPELGVALRTAPPDTALPLVHDLTDAARARVLLEAAIRAGAADGTGPLIAAGRPRVMRYDRGSRCTVRYELEHDGDRTPGVVVAKTYGDDRGRNAYRAMRALWSSDLSRSSVVAIAEPLAYAPDLRLLVQGPVPGDRTLEEFIGSLLPVGSWVAVDELDEYLARTAEGLAALHGCGVTWGEPATLEGEVAGIRALVEQLAGPVPELSGAAAPLLARVLDLAAGHPAGPARPSHGTFRPAQVLIHRGRVGFIDFDSFCQAEPALDVARFRAGIKDRGMRAYMTEAGGVARSPEAISAALTSLGAVCDGFLRHYEAVAPVSRERVALWETLDLLTQVLHAWTRPSKSRLTARMLILDEHVRCLGLMAPVHPSAAPKPSGPRAA
ncbi:MAG TPA: phosphotransferase [Candidatus Dormibacteraeota bacterium]|nr:phosphotransferase [Candidatus Dormibacteraeota bacterium]